MNEPTNISVLILTYNEADNIVRCLDSVSWSNDILVVDSGSDDTTATLARDRGARVLVHEWMGFAEQRNWGLKHGALTGDWVLHLDADEVVSSALQQELADATSRGRYPAYRVPSKTMFMGRWLRHAGLYPSYQVRFGRRDVLRFTQVGHGQREDLSPENVGTLSEPLIHHAFSKGLADWFQRHNRYSTDEAVRELEVEVDTLSELLRLSSIADPTERRRTLKRVAARLPLRPLLRFLYMYCLRGGFRDGRAGLVYSSLLAVYEYQIVVKKEELRLRRRGMTL